MVHIYVFLCPSQLKPHELYILFLTNHPTVAFPAEQKLLLVPLMFIFLRVWDIVDDILIVYYHTGDGEKLLWLQILTVSVVVVFYCVDIYLYPSQLLNLRYR